MINQNAWQTLKYMYPSADPLRDYRLQDDRDGTGPHFKWWDEAKLGSQPTEEQIAAKDAEAIAALQAEQDQYAQAVALLKSLKAQGKLTPAELAICAVLRRGVAEMRE